MSCSRSGLSRKFLRDIIHNLCSGLLGALWRFDDRSVGGVETSGSKNRRWGKEMKLQVVEEPICREVKNCRVCGSPLKDVIDLGSQFVVDFVPKVQDGLLRVPLKLARCRGCSLVQLRHLVNQDRLFRKFWYKSSTNEQMLASLKEIVERARSVAYLHRNDNVLDIGANDGGLLNFYPSSVKTVACDPCAELVENGLQQGRFKIGVKSFFSKEAVEAFGPFKIITAIAMFYDVPDPVQFLKDCKSVLRDDGVLIIQMNYLPAMLENMAVDNICHEHLTYFTLSTMKVATDMAGLEIVGAETNSVNGGSLRVYLTHKDSGLYGVSSKQQVELFMNAMNMIHREQKANLDTDTPYLDFGNRVTTVCHALQDYLSEEAAKGAKIYAYGASTRGTVLLQLLNLSDGTLLGCAERDIKKYGLYMVGSNLQIFPEEMLRDKATHFLVLPWHLLDSIQKRELDWMRRGGKMIVPLPEPRVLTFEGTTNSEMLVKTKAVTTT